MRLIRPPKRSLFGFYDTEGVRLLTCLRVEFSDLREHKFRNNCQCSSPMCFCQTGIETTNTFSCTAHTGHGSHLRDLLDRISNVVDVDPKNLSSTDLCTLLLNGNSCSLVDTNHHSPESTIFFVKSTSRFKQIYGQIIKQIVTTLTLFLSLYFFCIAYLFTYLFCFSLVNKSCCQYLEQHRLATPCHFSVALNTLRKYICTFYLQ